MIIDNLTIAAIVTTVLVSLFLLATRGCLRCSRATPRGNGRRRGSRGVR